MHSLGLRCLFGGASALLAGAGLTACASTASPAPHAHPSRAVAATEAPAPPACAAGQLGLTLDRAIPPLANQPGAFFRLENDSSALCTLDGYPTAQALSSTGTPIGRRSRHGGGYQIADPGPRVVTVVPGDSAYFGFDWTVTNRDGSTAGCVDTSGISVLLPGTKVPIRAPAALEHDCLSITPAATALAPAPAFAAIGSPARP